MQPGSNIYRLFDNVLVLSHGEMVYYGSAAESLDHFASLGYECPKNYNPADYLIDLVTMSSEGTIQTLARSYRESVQYNEIRKVMQNVQSEGNPFEGQSDLIGEYASSWSTQFKVLAKRTFLHNIRNPYLIRTQYILTVSLALLIGTIYWHVTD